MKKFTIILILVAAIFTGYILFHFGLFLLKIFVGLFVAALIGSGAYLGYLIGKNISRGKI